MAMEGRSFSLADVLEAVQINRDFASALRFLSHSCPICQEQVSFSKVSRRFEPANQSARSRLMFFFSVSDHHNDALLLLPVSDVLQDVLHNGH